jgi:peptidyl-prolyl cis-trans isomerase SurA
MNKFTLLAFFLFFSTNVNLISRTLVNKIIARVSNVNILQTDIEVPRIDKQVYTLDEVVAQILYFEQALKRQLIPSNVDIEQQISTYKTSNNIKTEKELKESLSKHGFTIKRYKSELTKYIAVSNLLQMEIKSRVFVTAQEVENYYKKHPEWIEEKYILKTCIVPFDQVEDKSNLSSLSKKTDLDWIKTDDWVNKSELSEQISFVSKMNKGQISKPIKTQYGYQLVMLVEKKERAKSSLDERYVEIEKKLKEEKMGKVEKEYKEELLKKANVVYLD